MVGYGQLIRQNKNFRNLWFGQIISMFGDWFNLIASAALIAQLTESGLAVGALFVARMLAPFLVSPVAGVVADQFNRKTILIVSDVARAMTAFGFLLVREPEHVWLIYTLTFIQLGISGFFNPTYNALLPDLVNEEELGTANVLGTITWSVMLTLGAAVGGLVSGIFGIYTAFTIDGITFLLSIVFLMMVVYRPDGDVESDQSVSAALQSYMDGLHYLRQKSDILLIALHKSFLTVTTWAGIQVIQVSIAENLFVIGEGGSISLGLMFAFQGIGAALGPVVGRYIVGDDLKKIRRFIITCYLIDAVGLAIAATLFNFPVILFAWVLIGFGSGNLWVMSSQLLMTLLPNEMRGRVFSVEFALHTLFSAIAAGLAGYVLDIGLSIAGLLIITAVFSIVPALIWGYFGVSRAPVAELAFGGEQGSGIGDR
ncbi:MAG: MFS transporter [Chloroflexota bacterium]